MIAVTGATGNVGRHLVAQLASAGHPVRALVRDPQRVAPAEGVEPVLADYTQRAALAALFTATDALFLHLAATGEHTGAVLDAAREAGVRRVVLLSSGIINNDDETLDADHPLHVEHARAEKLVRESGLDRTFLRPNAFATNALQWAPQIRSGATTVRDAFARAAAAPLHEADLAAVAVRALVDDGHSGAALRITGPEALTAEEQVHLIGSAIGRDLTFDEIPESEVTPDMYPHVPPQMFPRFLKTLAALAEIEPEITTTVTDLTGNPARTFRQWAEDHAADFGER
ncbi:SDR family oxidoreductase [Streptomyces sp. NPDC002851]